MKREYAFDMKLWATVRVEATNQKEARELIRQHIDAASCSAGEWPDGAPIVFEASVDPGDELVLVEVDGEDTEN